MVVCICRRSKIDTVVILLLVIIYTLFWILHNKLKNDCT